MEPKDNIALLGIAATLVVALVNLVYMIRNSRKTAFVNTVTTSRLKWIDSVRDKVSSFIVVTQRILEPGPKDAQNVNALLRERGALMHQIILHLNPHDAEDQAIQHSVEQMVGLTSKAKSTPELQGLLVDLRKGNSSVSQKRMDAS